MIHWIGVTGTVTVIVLASMGAATVSAAITGLSSLQWKQESDYGWGEEVGDNDKVVLSDEQSPDTTFLESSGVTTGSGWTNMVLPPKYPAQTCVDSSILMSYRALSNRAPEIGVAIQHDRRPVLGYIDVSADSWGYSRMLDTVAFLPTASAPPHASLIGTDIVWQLTLSGVSGNTLSGNVPWSWVKVGVSEAPDRTVDLGLLAGQGDLFSMYENNGSFVNANLQFTTPVGYIAAGTPGFADDTLAGQMSAVLGVIFHSNGRSGSAFADFGNTLELTGITFSGGEYDGMTPEDAGFDVIFTSGSRSPNLPPIPEPSTLVLLGIGGISLLGYTWRRRRA